MNAYAATFPREHSALAGQMISLGLALADSLSQLTGTAWAAADPRDVHVGTHYATWTIVRADGFRLKLSRQGRQGAASFDAIVPRGHVVLDRSAPAPLRARRSVHVFDPWQSYDLLAAEVLAHVVEPAETEFRHLRAVLLVRETNAAELVAASAALAAVLGPAVSDPRDGEGCSHLLHEGQVLGRVRLSRGGSSSLEVNGLDHDTVIAVAALIKARLAADVAVPAESR